MRDLLARNRPPRTRIDTQPYKLKIAVGTAASPVLPMSRLPIQNPGEPIRDVDDVLEVRDSCINAAKAATLVPDVYLQTMQELDLQESCP